MKSFKNFNEAVKGQDTESRKEGAKERAAEKKSGKIRKNTLDPKDYATQQKKSIEWHDKRTKGRFMPGQVTDVHEVAPPGWGHTKAEKEKTDPSKPKSKIGGSAAAFKRALDDGRFKGLPGDKTKKEKTASMFKLMWSMKKKGDKPHYKPGTDEKYKKYQEEGASIIQGGTSSKKVSYRGATSEKSQPKKSASFRGEKDESIPSKHKSARYASQLHRLRPRSERVKDVGLKKEGQSSFSDKSNTFTQESLGFTIDSGEHKKASKKAKIRNLAKGNTNPNEKAAAEKKAGGPKLIGELNIKDTKKLQKASVLATSDDPKDQDRARARQVEIDYKDLMKQRKAKKVGVGKSMKEETLVETPYRGEGVGRVERAGSPNPIGIADREKAKETVKKVAKGVGKVAGSVVKKVRDTKSAAADVRKKGTQFKTGLADRIRKGVKSGAKAVGKVGAEVKKGYEAGLKNEAKMTPMQDNNLFGNAYAGSAKLQREKKKAIESIPNKKSEEYNKNWQHKTPDNPRESVELLGADGKVAHEIIDIIKPEPMKVPESPMKWKELVEKVKLPAVNGSIINVYLTWRGRGISIKLFFPQSRTRRPTREEVNSQIQKVYPGAKVGSFVESDPEPGEPFLQVGD